jgi:hypothetical protein
MNIESWVELLLHSDQGSTAPPATLAFMFVLAFALGQIVGWMYLLTHTGQETQRSFVGALVVLPVIVTLLMMLMTGGLMVAFGLLAVFAVVRFRNVLRDTRDTIYVLWAIVEGMAVGTMRYSTAIVGVAAVAIVLAYLRLTNFGVRRPHDGCLSIEVCGEESAGRRKILQLLKRHAKRWSLAGDQITSSNGLVLSYDIYLRDRRRANDLRDELAEADQLHEVSYIPFAPQRDGDK